jgi:lipopolysaccharide transport system ATP-binding protein
MTNKISIRVNHLSKKYKLGGQQERYLTIRDTIVNSLKSPFKTFHSTSPDEGFWALKDVSFEVEHGEVVGIIGRNGAGKSTLLKILSRITIPTEGTVEIHGRVGSLLEVGTGFHPELTGRENIFLNGSIIGMKKVEIEQKFDEIVKFSEIEKFLDTPVKRYSSGMYVRLAFAVAAHLEPEILIVDEVLAVGDAAFQKKCLGKMGEVANEGRTVLFVSHNMSAIEQLCKHCILIEQGRIKHKGSDVREIIKDYLQPSGEDAGLSQWINNADKFSNPWFIPKKMFICDDLGDILNNPVNNFQDIWLQIEGVVGQLDPGLQIGYTICNEAGLVLYWSYFTDQKESQWPNISTGPFIFKTKIPKRFLTEGSYTIDLIGGLRYRSWIFEPGATIPTLTLVIQGGFSDSPYWTEKRPGVIAPIMEWTGESSK